MYKELPFIDLLAKKNIEMVQVVGFALIHLLVVPGSQLNRKQLCVDVQNHNHIELNLNQVPFHQMVWIYYKKIRRSIPG